MLVKKMEPALKKLLLLFITTAIFASMILNINVKEGKERVDLLLNFDTPFNGKILQKQAKDRVELTLKGVTILAPWQKKLNSGYVYQIDIIPLKKDSKVVLYTVDKVRVYAARSKDGYSLKISVKPPKTAAAKKEDLSGLDFESIKKYLLIFLGVGIVAFLLVLFVRWLNINKEPIKSKRVVVPSPKSADFEIKFEKELDERNKVALISFKGINYLVIIGSSNILLGKYKEGEIETAEEFEKAIESQNISDVYRSEESELFTTIEEYKKRASGI